MFDIGLEDTITVKKQTGTGKSSAGNPTKTWATIIDSQQCRVIKNKAILTDDTGKLVVINYRTVKVNYSGSDLKPECMAIVNGIQEEITEVNPARGFNRDYNIITLKDRDG